MKYTADQLLALFNKVNDDIERAEDELSNVSRRDRVAHRAARTVVRELIEARDDIHHKYKSAEMTGEPMELGWRCSIEYAEKNS